MDKRYQVFISSTYEDLKAERDAVIKAVLEMGHFPVGMEMFNAADEEQWVTIQREIDRSDYYLLIVAHRYGSTIPTEGGISYTEKEFDYAVSTNVPRIGFVVGKDVPWDTKFTEQGKIRKKLDAFKQKVKARPVDFWTSKEDLATKVVLSLGKLIANTNRPGWQRGSGTTEEVATALARLSEENTRLRDEVARFKLLSEPQPELEFYFTDEHGIYIGNTLHEEISDLNAQQRYIDKTIIEIQTLIDKYDNTYRNALEQRSLSEGFIKVDVPSARRQNVIDELEKLGLKNVPAFSLNSLFTRHTMGVVRAKWGEPSGGRDLENYTIFRNIELILTDLERNAREYGDSVNAMSYRFACQNKGRIAVEQMQIRYRVAPDNASFRSDLFPELVAEHSYSAERQVPIIVPHEDIAVMVRQATRANVPGEIVISIQALAKNLPEPQEHQLRIVFDDPSTEVVVD